MLSCHLLKGLAMASSVPVLFLHPQAFLIHHMRKMQIVKNIPFRFSAAEKLACGSAVVKAKFAGSGLDEENEFFFQIISSFRPPLAPGVYSAAEK
jgi:hypothetical protein